MSLSDGVMGATVGFVASRETQHKNHCRTHNAIKNFMNTNARNTTQTTMNCETNDDK